MYNYDIMSVMVMNVFVCLFVLLSQVALTVRLGWLVEILALKDVLRYVSVDSGVQSAMTNGMTMLPKQCVVSWDTL